MGRSTMTHSSSSTSLARQASALSLNEQNQNQQDSYFESQSTNPKHILAQVADWLHKEKSKRHKQKTQQYQAKSPFEPAGADNDNGAQDMPTGEDSDLALDKLEGILSRYLKSHVPSIGGKSPLLAPTSPLLLGRKGSIASKLKRNSVAGLSSDTDFFGEEVMVPNVEAYLDNSKTLAYTGGTTSADASDKAKRKDQKHWVVFKEDILRLTHTLKLKGWRRIPMERGGEIDVARLSGEFVENCARGPA